MPEPIDIAKIQAMNPQEKAATIRTLEKKIATRFAIFFGIKFAVLVGLSLWVRAASKAADKND